MNLAGYEFPSGKGKGKPQYAAISASSNGANVIVAGTANCQILVLAYLLVSAGTVTATWESSAGSLLSGALPLVANGSIPADFSPVGHMQTVKGEGLTLFLSSGVAVTGHLVYALIS